MPTTSAPIEESFQDALAALFRLHGQVLEAADRMAGDVGLTGARWQVMRVVAKRPLTASQVARRLGLQRQSVQRTVDFLREDGIVEIAENLDHRRAGLVTLTDPGRERLAALERRQQAWLQRCLLGLDRAGLDALAVGLANLADRVEDATAHEAARPQGRKRAAA
ncbi:MAG: MarR family transcriptional regulator [Steroidobacteraceae bacterium]|jgi:DNA-binding MarR family transcriptional regulator|nr:MarR family transcriptional regulator [Steroidobacteraceae bacterium]